MAVVENEELYGTMRVRHVDHGLVSVGRGWQEREHIGDDRRDIDDDRTMNLDIVYRSNDEVFLCGIEMVWRHERLCLVVNSGSH